MNSNSKPEHPLSWHTLYLKVSTHNNIGVNYWGNQPHKTEITHVIIQNGSLGRGRQISRKTQYLSTNFIHSSKGTSRKTLTHSLLFCHSCHSSHSNSNNNFINTQYVIENKLLNKFCVGFEFIMSLNKTLSMQALERSEAITKFLLHIVDSLFSINLLIKFIISFKEWFIWNPPVALITVS